MFAIVFIVRKYPASVKRPHASRNAVQMGGKTMLKKINDLLAGLPMTIVAGVFFAD